MTTASQAVSRAAAIVASLVCNTQSRFEMKSVVVIFSLVFGTSVYGQARSITANLPIEFVPAGYVVLEQIQGDLNNDNQQDYVLIIKDMEKANFVIDERGRELDRN